MKTAIVHARIDPETKRSAEKVLERLGVSPPEVIRILYRQITLRQGLPFAVEIPNDLTTATLRKSRKGVDIEQFNTLEAMFENWKK